MKETTNRAVAPEGWHTVTPRIVAHDAKRFVEFVKQVFGAVGEYLEERPTVLLLGDSQIMISEAGVRSPTTAFLYVYVADVDAAYQSAVNAGARTIEPPLDTPYGDRRCMVQDDWGNMWQIARYASDR